ncbi:hypothetical protein [Clostridium felsineum]|uniref:hypothetical protein n=1 Tax=Clostridium felsineum TaxID=36839 RepID=UPI00098CCE87|nr:hypothetical protein [Clostridium felsineum]URZ15483.1 hypothetical protein CLFE_015230 [Clostridium felsineum DSM 794]
MENKKNYAKSTELLSNLAKVNEKNSNSAISNMILNSSKVAEKNLNSVISNMILNSSKVAEKNLNSVISNMILNSSKVAEKNLNSAISNMILNSSKVAEKNSNSAISNMILNFSKVAEKNSNSDISNMILNSSKVAEKNLNSVISNTILNIVKATEINESILDIKVNNDGTIDCLDEKNIDVEKNINEIQNIFSQKANQTLYNKVEGFKKSHFIIFILLYIFIINPISSSIDDYIKQGLKVKVVNICNLSKCKNPKTISKKIKKPIYSEIKKQVNNKYIRSTVISNYRFVNTNSLNVRVSDSMKSYSIYKLKLCQVVKIIHKNKNWTRIEYENEDGSIVIRGWVNTRYISRFK